MKFVPDDGIPRPGLVVPPDGCRSYLPEPMPTPALLDRRDRRAGPPGRYGYTRAALADAGARRAILEGAFDRHLRPWRHPDRNPFPTIVLFPRLERTLEILRRGRARVRDLLDEARDR